MELGVIIAIVVIAIVAFIIILFARQDQTLQSWLQVQEKRKF